MFDVVSSQKHLAEAIKAYLGADKVFSTDEDNYLHRVADDDCMVITLSWRATGFSKFLRSEKAFSEAFRDFLSEVSSRITLGEVADLRKQVAQLESKVRDQEKLMVDLQRYKTAYELNK